MIRHGVSEEQKLMAAATVRKLAMDDDNKVLLGKACAMDPLIDLARAGSEQQKEEAAGALWLMIKNPQNNAHLQFAGSITPRWFYNTTKKTTKEITVW